MGDRKGVTLVYLQGDERLIADPINQRQHRHMLGSLLQSQFEALEGPDTEPAVAVPAAAEGVGARVVSMPSWEVFEEPDAAYRESVLPRSVTTRATVEEGSRLGWQRYPGPGGVVLGMRTSGISARSRWLPNMSASPSDGVVRQAIGVGSSQGARVIIGG